MDILKSEVINIMGWAGVLKSLPVELVINEQECLWYRYLRHRYSYTRIGQGGSKNRGLENRDEEKASCFYEEAVFIK